MTTILLWSTLQDIDLIQKSIIGNYITVDSPLNNIMEINAFFDENLNYFSDLSHFAFMYENNDKYMTFFNNEYVYFNGLFRIFVEKIKEHSPKCVIDILTCNLQSSEQQDEINRMSNEIGIPIRYSIDETGNYNNGGDWIMESHNVNIKDIYFNENINEWNYTLGGQFGQTMGYSHNTIYENGSYYSYENGQLIKNILIRKMVETLYINIMMMIIS